MSYVVRTFIIIIIKIGLYGLVIYACGPGGLNVLDGLLFIT